MWELKRGWDEDHAAPPHPLCLNYVEEYINYARKNNGPIPTEIFPVPDEDGSIDLTFMAGTHQILCTIELEDPEVPENPEDPIFSVIINYFRKRSNYPVHKECSDCSHETLFSLITSAVSDVQ